jgi:uncharacterized paraquat-inducible protein A
MKLQVYRMENDPAEQRSLRDVLLLLAFSVVTPYAYLWLMGYLIAYSPLLRAHRLFSEPSSALVVVSLGIATLLHSLLLAVLLAAPFGFLVSSNRWRLLFVFLSAVLLQIHFVFSPGRAVSPFMWIDYLSVIVSMSVAFLLGCRLRLLWRKTRFR